MAPPAPIQIPLDCSKDMVLGQVVEAVNGLRESNEKDHQKIFERLDEGDKYLAVLKVSRCMFTWLDGNGAFYALLSAAFLLVVGWATGKI
jgi:hypothetical protein